MIWLIQDFDLLSVLLRALTLSFEALTAGGIFFLFLVATPAVAETEARNSAARFCSWAALALAATQILTAAASIVMMVGGSDISLHEAMTADFFFADLAVIAAAFLLFLYLRLRRFAAGFLPLLLATVIVAASVALSHAAARLDHRALLFALTAVHHLGAAAWIGAMPYLLVALRGSSDSQCTHILVRRYSNMAVISVIALVLAGIGMSVFYVGSWNGLYGSSYGLMLLAKVYLLLLALCLGGGNFMLVRRGGHEAAPLLMRLRRFSEAEIGIVFTAILVAASLTSQPPAADMQQNMLTGHEVVERLAWKSPSLTTPGFAQLSKRNPLREQLESTVYSGGSPNDAMDRAWSEYNHHWAGMVVLAAGIFACCASFLDRRWTRNWFHGWPLLFVGLAVFIILRADADAWPLGPRSFWGSFAEAEVLEHRIFALLIVVFAVFEWAVETGRLQSPRAALVFPALCAGGGAFLMTHSHSLGAPKEETLVEMSHSMIALLGVTAGWSRWLQLRLPERGNAKIKALMGWVWPLCLVLVGVVLLDYRES